MNSDLLKKYAGIVFFESIILGVLYAYLFTWKSIGLSFAVYSSSLFLIFFVNIFLVEGFGAFKRLNWVALLAAFVLTTSGLFIYRLNSYYVGLAFVVLPFLYWSFLASCVNKDLLKNFGFLSFITIPVTFLVSMFVDLFKFVSNLKFGKGLSDGAKSVIGRVVLGIVLSLPFLFVIFSLLYSADTVFAKYMKDFFSTSIWAWFKDPQTTVMTLGSVLVAIVISILNMIFLFALYNPESLFNSMLSKGEWMRLSNWKRNWDFVVSNTVIAMINLVFVVFIIIQFVYLFGGEKNINGLNMSLTYAEYARRGFFELIALSGLMFVLSFVFNFKVFASNLIQKIFYRLNHLLMVVSVLVITYSANARLMMYESVFGYTNLRLVVHIAIAFIAIMYVLLYVSLLSKRGEQFINFWASMFFVVFALLLTVVPLDYVSAKLNYERYLSEKKIDFNYLATLSNEAVPVLIDMSTDSRVEENIREMVKANLKLRYEKTMKDTPFVWQSYNYFFEFGKRRIPEVVGSTNWVEQSKESVVKLLNGYAKLLSDGKFDDAFNQYWVPTSLKMERGSYKIKMMKYSVDMSSVDTQINSWLYNPSQRSLVVQVNVEYALDESALNAKFPEYREDVEYLYLQNFNGQWRIVDSTLFKLGAANNNDYSLYNNWRYIEDSSYVMPMD